MNARPATLILAASLLLSGCGESRPAIERGYLHAQWAEWPEALAAYDEAIAADPSDSEALVGRGRAYYALGRLDDAMTDYNEAIRVAPEYCESYYLRAVIYEERGQSELAEADQQFARQLDPAKRLAMVGQPWTPPSERLPPQETDSAPESENDKNENTDAGRVRGERSTGLAGEDDLMRRSGDDELPPAGPRTFDAPEADLPPSIEERLTRRMTELAPSRDALAGRGLGQSPLAERGALLPHAVPSSPLGPRDVTELSNSPAPERRTTALRESKPSPQPKADETNSTRPEATRQRSAGLSISLFDRGYLQPRSATPNSPLVGPSPIIGPSGPPTQSPFARPGSTTTLRPTQPLNPPVVIGPAAPPSQSPFGPLSLVAPSQPSASPVEIGPSAPPSQSPFARPSSVAPLQLSTTPPVPLQLSTTPLATGRLATPSQTPFEPRQAASVVQRPTLPRIGPAAAPRQPSLTSPVVEASPLFLNGNR